jgi:hypothetical protein
MEKEPLVIVTRIGYCDECAKKHFPFKGQVFLPFGSTSGDYHMLKAKKNGLYGFVPTTYCLIEKLKDNKVLIEKSCAMLGCGIECRDKHGVPWYSYIEFKKEIWSVKRWNGLVLLKHNIFTFDYEI